MKLFTSTQQFLFAICILASLSGCLNKKKVPVRLSSTAGNASLSTQAKELTNSIPSSVTAEGKSPSEAIAGDTGAIEGNLFSASSLTSEKIAAALEANGTTMAVGTSPSKGTVELSTRSKIKSTPNTGTKELEVKPLGIRLNQELLLLFLK